MLDEAVLQRHVGGRNAMASQLRKLLSVADLGNVEIRVIPFRNGERLGLWGSLMILEFAAPEDEEIAFVEYQMGDSIIDGGAHLVAPYLKKFWSLETISASVEESVALVEDSLRKLS
ncbi:Scr1 family TA system antitoxin-like transcriptional regulator [Catenuloplanes indicus]|nr:Scr1 family TA system antitoxin-like transcriptional regulator [Catenuloplanes indicus]